MKCEKAKKSIGTLRDGAADAQLKIQMENHLAICFSCRAAFDRLQALGSLLQKDVPPSPSPLLEQKLMQAFCAKHERSPKPAAWWKSFFAGSISVPKPVFAAALIACALALGWAKLVEKNATMSADIINATRAPHISSPPPLPFPQTIERTKIVEVPVFKERVVKNNACVEKRSAEPQKSIDKPADFYIKKLNPPGNSSSSPVNPNAPSLQMSASIAENGYFTRANLKDFEPASESNVRIIRREKTDEK